MGYVRDARTAAFAASPAGAATLNNSLGLFTAPDQLLILRVAVALLAAVAFAINRLAGIAYPSWNPKRTTRD